MIDPFFWLRKKEKKSSPRSVKKSDPFSALSSLQQRLYRKSSYPEKNEEIKLSDIGVVSFVGPSGTGKSSRALELAEANDIHYIIDDGLLIHGSKILAGSSAKKAGTKLESVRQALFLDPTRAANMRRALIESRVKALMILGTSDAMLDKICENLHLNKPSILIRIEDVSSEEDRLNARKARMTEGSHIIPVPSMELKYEFSGYFQESLSAIRRRLGKEKYRPEYYGHKAKTVVRPTFSALGKYSISDEAISHMLKYILDETEGVGGLIDCNFSKYNYGIIIDLKVSLMFAYEAPKVLKRIQSVVVEEIERYTSITVLAINVSAVKVVKEWSKNV